METKRLIISGKVQGVFYRASAKNKADELNVSGWIKNTPEGNVEAMITGTSQQLDDFIQWCKSGPVRAKVDEITIEKLDLRKYNSFEIVH